MDKLTELLKDQDFSPLMGEKLNPKNSLFLDFSVQNPVLQGMSWQDTRLLNDYVFGLLEANGKSYGIGGYLENRAIYQRSEVFGKAESGFRDIHLGMDIWTYVGRGVYAPMDGRVHSFQDNQGFGNYGPTIILEHYCCGEVFHTLYGHVMRSDLQDLYVGKPIEKGDGFCHVGPFPENGDWPPHLHFQIIKDLWGHSGDFPGVCSAADVDKYKANCPDPNLIIQVG